jgi:hypothetical protein
MVRTGANLRFRFVASGVGAACGCGPFLSSIMMLM